MSARMGRGKRLAERGAAVAAAVGAVVATGVAVAPPAPAAMVWPSHSSTVYGRGGFVTTFACPWPESSICGQQYVLRNGATVYMRCYSDNQYWVGEYATNRWFIVYVPQTGTDTWINASWIPTGSQAVVPTC